MSRDRELDPRQIQKALERRGPRFELGAVVGTPGAIENVPAEEIQTGLDRHHRGDWGELDDEDRAANEAALEDGTRLMSVYTARAGTTFWIITEADRSVTTVLLPEEY